MTAERKQRKGLARPSGYLIPRVVDQAAFCYVERTRVSQDQTGIVLSIEQDNDVLRARLPTAMIAALLLGPGTSITQAAMATLTRHGTTVSFVGEGAARCYASALGAGSTRWLVAVARASTDAETRLTVARRMYALRFGTDVGSESIEQLRGMEGARVKALYKSLSEAHGVSFKRSYGDGRLEGADPINRALSAANACLYGVTAAVVASLGIHPGLGVIHTGSPLSLVYDIADLYKAETTIPVAFAHATALAPERTVRHALRDQLTLIRLVPRMVDDIGYLFGLHDKQSPLVEPSFVSLWDPGQVEGVRGGINYAPPGALSDDPPGTETW